MKKIGLLALLGLAVMTAGCRTNPVGRYFLNRGNDFLDIFKFNMSAGVGVQVQVRATKAFQAGVGLFDGVRLGVNHRSVGVVTEARKELGVSLIYLHDLAFSQKKVSNPECLLGSGAGGAFDVSQTNDRTVDEVGAAVHLIVIGFDVGFSPVEFLDFLLGWVGVDFGNCGPVRKEWFGGDDLGPPEADDDAGGEGG